MGIRVRTNVMSLIAQRHFGAATAGVNKHAERLSSGYRINKAADDAAGLAISETIRADIRSLQQARRNANDSVSMIQVAEGSLEEITSIVVRLRELGVQAASDTIGARERQYLDMEYKQLKDEIDRISVSTEFNGTRLLIGENEMADQLFDSHNFPPLEFQIDKEYFPISDSLDARNPVNIIRFDHSKYNAMTSGEGSLGLGTSDDPDGSSVDTKVNAQNSIALVDQAMEKISTYRANLGAIQNRLQSTERNLGVRIENLTRSRSRIKDADFAEETANYTQQSILQKAGASILSQANQLPGIALQLLGS